MTQGYGRNTKDMISEKGLDGPFKFPNTTDTYHQSVIRCSCLRKTVCRASRKHSILF